MQLRWAVKESETNKVNATLRQALKVHLWRRANYWCSAELKRYEAAKKFFRPDLKADWHGPFLTEGYGTRR